MAKAKKSVSKKPVAKKKNIGKKRPVKKAAAKKAVKKKSLSKSSAPVERPVKNTGVVDEIAIRMYCHGFGDCFLLTCFSKGSPAYRMLIDCGMLTGETDRLRKCIEHIKSECGNHLDLVVQTHEHKDHISGFNLKDRSNKKLLWDTIEVDNVWLAWTENTEKGGDSLAITLKKKFKKKKKALAKALGLYNRQIKSASHVALMNTEFRGSEYHSAQQRYANALQQLLNFYDIGPNEVNDSLGAGAGELGLTMKDAMKYFIERNKKHGSPHINFWNPGDFADSETTGLNGIKFYFLGPPKDYELLRKMDDKEHVEMYLSDMNLSDNFYLALSDNGDSEISPFYLKYKVEKKDFSPIELKDPDNAWVLYNDSKNEWRKIATDWLQNAGTLALHLDSYTNNTSLVIAIEFEASGKVLLFPADAQIGNWISWTQPAKEGETKPALQWNNTGTNKVITAEDLMNRTVFYKVGHHASHNATAKKHGLELMNSPELAAMIPVDEAVAKRQGKKGWKMPAEDLYIRLQEKTKGRIIRLDTGNIIKKGVEDVVEGAKPTQQQRQQFNKNVRESVELIQSDDGQKRPMYWEYRVKG